MRPRFFLVLGYQIRGHLTPPWPGSGRADHAGQLDGEWVAWRVVGSNHRELGRSAGVFDNAEAAREAIAAARGGVEQAAVITETLRGMWGWQLHIGGVPAVVSSRLYQRARDCADSLAAAVAGIKVAELRDTVPRLRR